jgi:hypothetical protein
LQRAKEVLQGLETQNRAASLSPQAPVSQMSLSLEAHAPENNGVLAQLRALETESMTPLQALQTLHELQSELLAKEPR